MQQNRLARETSPYLLQHAHNPVDWWPWGEEALTRARRENKLILLSIGYSACHWCHVMAHESFEDAATAEVMNRHYINIKVDREERPDLDKIYQTAHHLLNQRAGGWPLTAILTPDDLNPFFIGTYFPKTPRHGMPAFTEILQSVVRFYHEHEDDIRQQNHSLISSLQQSIHSDSVEPEQLSPPPLDQARRELANSFDHTHAGFGAAPKFPHPTSLERLLRHWAATCTQQQADAQALKMARFTLHAMASGGIYDQLGGGFYRYSVDERWMIPHFEKMLYDNGPLLALYADAWAATDDADFKRICEETAAWVMREMQSPEGAYYATLDADSEGEEGKFYVWKPAEVKQLLTATEYNIAAAHYGLQQTPNFEGQWHLHVYQGLPEIADKLGLAVDEAAQQLTSARNKLLHARETRPRPGRDEKILTSWNGLMIKGMAVAGRRLNDPSLIQSAQTALDFIRDKLFQDGRLLASYKDGQARLMAYLDDYVFLIDAVMECLQSQWRTQDLHFAIQLADVVLEQFEDPQHGGFYFTANDHEQLYHRPKPFSDESMPAGNGIAAYALQRLGHLLGEHRYIEAAERALRAAWPAMQQIPYAHCAMLLALEEYLYPTETFVIRGQGGSLLEWQGHCQTRYRPRMQCYAIPADEDALPGLLAERKAEAQTVAYHCSGTSCKPVIRRLEALNLSDTPAMTG